MAALSKWACLPLLLVASVISFASAARIFPSDTDDHSSISTRTTNPSDDLDWLPVSRVKRKLSITPSQHGKDDDHFSVSTSIDNAVISFPTPAPIRLFEKGEGVMSDEDVDHKDSLFRHSSGKEIDEIMDDLEDVGMDSSNTDGGFDDDECDTLLCGWGWNRGSGYDWGHDGSGTNGGGGGDGGGGIGGGGGGGGGIGSIGGGGGGGGGGNGGDGGRGGDSNGWSWDGGSSDGDRGGIGWDWGGGGSNGGGHIGRGGISMGGSGGSGRNRWHWGWHRGGGGSKVAVSNDHNPNTTDASGMSSNSATAPAPMSI